jgi:L-threonylcarbamoyladenylate synthase
MTAETPVILRPGWVTREMLAETTGPVERARRTEELQRSPGTRSRHYSPRARVILIQNGSPQSIRQTCEELLEGNKTGFIGHTPTSIENPDFNSIILENSAEDYARSIYGALRSLDETGVGVIVVEGIGECGAGAAVMERLRRAASDIRTMSG